MSTLLPGGCAPYCRRPVVTPSQSQHPYEPAPGSSMPTAMWAGGLLGSHCWTHRWLCSRQAADRNYAKCRGRRTLCMQVSEKVEHGGPTPKSGYLVEGLFSPVIICMAVSLFIYPILAQSIAGVLDTVALDVIKGDVSQYMQNFFSYNGLLFSFFASQTYAVLYSQQESVYFALYAEVSEARSLMEQLTLVSQGRPYYPALLRCLEAYANELFLGVRLGCPPAVLVSGRPEYDPLERILYLTSVGVPSVLYDTVRSLRQARGVRLAASQPKLPTEHFVLLCFLGGLELLVFPLLGAGISGYEPDAALPGHVLSFQSVVFAFLVGAVVLTLQILRDMQRSPTGGLYDLKQTLDRLLEGFAGELKKRFNDIPKDENEVDAGYVVHDLPPSSADVTEVHIPPQPIPSLSSREWRSLEPRRVGDFSKGLALTIGVGLVSAVAFPVFVELIRNVVSEPTLLAIREDNNAQWLQNFFTGVGFIFSLFVAQTFTFLFGQQESLYYALYAEVSEAKALLEQLTLVSSSRTSYADMLMGIQEYVRQDLYCFNVPPSQLLSRRSQKDPLENILYSTSVGLPSYVYETVRGIRQARGERLAALQRKLPDAHFVLLYLMGVLELSVFPILAAGCSALDQDVIPGHIVFFHATLFGLSAGALALTFITLEDLWDPTSGAYNVRSVLKQMVSGLEEELALRIESSKCTPADAVSESSMAASH
mmetsp:Transcript_67852/g.126775  ORF Transcript_67852/g.126775 Transcript_67852/m.126775 type:complete len:708 (+) Transcript_67852:87-2210(+)